MADELNILTLAFAKNAIRVSIPSSSGWELGSALQTFVLEYTKTS